MKKKFYLTLDTETATLPFANELCKTPKEKQKIAIAKPLVYDIGWVISDRQGNIVRKANYVIQETFFVPNVFNTAYYKDKRPIYMDLLEEGEIIPAKWNDVMDILISDLNICDLTAAYNACFDFKKAIPFTERYIKHLYQKDYNSWEQDQYYKCKKILLGKDDSSNPDYLEPVFEFRGHSYPIVDLWGISCERLLDTDRYRNYCLKNNLLTNSAMFFKATAETSFRYLMQKHDFTEDHTALSDALIEKDILTRALKKGKVEPGIKAFPFRDLGTTIEYIEEHPKYKAVVIEALKKYIKENDGEEKACGENGTARYWKRVLNTYERL